VAYVFDERGDFFDQPNILSFENRLKVHRVQITALFGEVSAFVKNVGAAATHAGGKIPAAGSEHQHQALGHVFAAVVADALDYRGRSRVANGEALTRDPIEKRFAASRAVESNVADENICLGSETRSSRRIDDQ